MEKIPDEESLALLRDLGVEYFLVDRVAYPNFSETLKEIESLGLELMAEFGDDYVFKYRSH